MARIPSPVLTSTGLIGGYAVARATKKRPLGGVVFAAIGAAAFEAWRRRAGVGAAATLSGVYVAALGASHLLARKLGAWPSVLTVTAATGAAAYLLGDRSASGGTVAALPSDVRAAGIAPRCPQVGRSHPRASP